VRRPRDVQAELAEAKATIEKKGNVEKALEETQSELTTFKMKVADNCTALTHQCSANRKNSRFPRNI